MYETRKLSEEDFIQYADIVSNAFPEFNVNLKEEKEKFIGNSIKIQNENPTMDFYGTFNDRELLGGMRFHNFRMRLLSGEVNAGGVGLLAVSAEHKKEKVAKEMVDYFLKHYREKECPIVMLYPFRADFYKKMGFGFGTSMCQFKVKPSILPALNQKEHVSILKLEDADALSRCYESFYLKTNGLIARAKGAFSRYFNSPLTRVLGYKKDGEVKGYLIYSYNPGNHGATDILVNEIIFENSEVLYELMTFLNRQGDQIRYAIFNIQDENFRFLLDNPGNNSNNTFAELYAESNIQGTGIMYRVVDVKKLFEDLKGHNFNNTDLTIKLTVKDTFLKDNDGSSIVKFDKGFLRVVEDENFDVEIMLDICDFSSLITCVVDFKSLYKYGKAHISDEKYMEMVNSLFNSCEKPLCMTLF